MNNRNRNNKNDKRGKKTGSPSGPTGTELIKQTLLLKQLLQQMKIGPGLPLPITPDVPLIQLRRNKPYTFTRSVSKGSISTATSIDVTNSLIFALSDLPGVGDMTALFDEYRISQVMVRFTPASGQSNTNLFHLSPLLTAIDYDDGGTTPIADLYQYNSLQVTPAGNICVRTVSPRFAVAAYSGVFTSFSQSQNYCDVASPGILWYGIKYAIAASGVVDYVYNIECEYTITLRQSR